MTVIDSNSNNLSAQIEQLDREIKPNRDLWPGIEQAIAKTPQELPEAKVSGVPVWSKMAAAFAPIALVTGLWLNQSGTQQIEPEWLTPVSATYELQKRQLLQQVSDRTPLDAQWQESLKELEAAESALKKALQAQPQDKALMRMLNQLYQQQLSLIEKSHQSKFKQI